MEDVKAVTRIEAILNGEDITPVTREEAILSGADVEPLSREEYFVQKRLAGGGGLDYVIPEQTVTLTDHMATLEGVDVSSLNIGDYIIINIADSEDDGYAASQFDNRVPGEEGFGEITIKGATYAIYVEDGNWLLNASVIDSLTIKAIKIVNF